MSYYAACEPNEPSPWEEELFERFADENPTLTESEIWTLVDEEIEMQRDAAAEARAERRFEERGW